MTRLWFAVVLVTGVSMPPAAAAAPAPAVPKIAGARTQAASIEAVQSKPQAGTLAAKNSKPRPASFELVNSGVFSNAVATSVLADVRDGLESHVRRFMLSAFDADKMDGYLNFEEQVDTFFEKYDGFRVHYRVVQTSTVDSRGVALVVFDLTQVPRTGAAAPSRRSGQIRFEMERGRKGWKIVDFRPREFFQ